MALEMMDEHEQSEFVRNWLRQNINAIVIGIAIGMAALFGWNWWKQQRVERAGQAQVQYAALVAAYEAKDADAIAKLDAELRSKYESTPYATFAALREAQAKLAAGDAKAAEASLAWARDHATIAPLEELASLRLARVKLDAGDAQGALELAQSSTNAAYKALAAETRADALLALGRREDAAQAYDEALTALDATSPRRQFVEMKRDDAASGATATATTTAPAPAPAPAPEKEATPS